MLSISIAVIFISGVILILRAFVLEPSIIDFFRIGVTPDGIDHLVGFIFGIFHIYVAIVIRKRNKNKN